MTRMRHIFGRRAMVYLSVLVLPGLAACTANGQSSVGQPAESSTAAPSEVRYVSPTGLDSSPGTEERPWGTLRHALSTVRRDQLLYVRGGDYHEELVKVPIHHGTAKKRVVVKAYPGERPVVHGLVWLRQPSYWTIDGLNVTWDPTSTHTRRQMVKLTGGVGWVWQNSEIWGSRGSTNMLVDGYGTREPARWSITGNCIHDVSPPAETTRSSNLTIGEMSAAGPGRVTRNLLFHAPGQQNVALGSATGGTSNVTFEHNTVYGGGAALALAGNTVDVRIMKNILGGVTSGLVIRWTTPQGARNVVTQNLGVQAEAFMRPATESVIGGPGNRIDSDLAFSDVSSCDGFRSNDPVALPYGRHAVG